MSVHSHSGSSWHTLGAHLLQSATSLQSVSSSSSEHAFQSAKSLQSVNSLSSEHLLQLQSQQSASQSAYPPLFYVSPLVSQFPDRPPRAGVPVMFPQFADRGPGPKHGIVRMVPWVRDAVDAWTLHVPPQPEQHWLGDAQLRVSAHGSAGISARSESGGASPVTSNMQSASDRSACASLTLTMRFEVENTGADTFSFTGGFHPYYAVSDVTQLRIEGLDAAPFEDRYGATGTVSQAFLQGQAFERLYLRADTLVMVDGARRVRMSADGFDNWMVWNPGIELARGLADLPDADWQRFICIEPVCAGRAVSLAPGERFVGAVTVEHTQ